MIINRQYFNKYYFSIFPTTLIQKEYKIVTSDWISNKKIYVQLRNMSNLWKVYTILDGVDYDILQVWSTIYP